MIYDWVRHQADKRPDNIAITHSNRHLTYGQIESESNKLAGLLQSCGLKRGGRVGILMDKTPETVIALHGISKAGGTYIPLNTNHPSRRISRIIQEFNVDMLMVDQSGLKKFNTIRNLQEMKPGLPWIWWTKKFLPEQENDPCFTYHDIEHQADFPYQRTRNEQQPAMMLFRTGKTGRLKADVTTHRSIISFIKWAVPFFKMKPEDRISGHSPLHFELSQFDIFGSFAAGAHLYLVPTSINNIPDLLAEFILENDLTQWFSVPSVLSYMASYDAISENGFPGLERLIWCGEVFPEPALRYWMNRLANASFTHLYGSNKKMSIASNYHTVSRIPEYKEEMSLSSLYSDSEIIILTDPLEAMTDGVIPAVEGIIGEAS